MINITFLKRVAIAICVLVAFPLSESLAQDFIMNTAGATYNATCGAVLKMNSSDGEIQRLNSNPLGTDSPNAVPGIVDWASTVAAPGKQNVQVLYYEKMMLSGSNKLIPGGINIVGIACNPAELFPDYEDFATYPFVVDDPDNTNNEFEDDFTYSGGPVTVFPLDGDDAYDDLVLGGAGPFTIEDGDTTEVTGSLSLDDPTSQLDVDGDLVLGGDPSDLIGNTTIDNGGSIQVGGGDLTFTGDITVDNGTLNGGTGEITIGPGSDLTLGGGGILDLDGGEVINITGDIINNGDGTNLALECTSIVNYDGAAGQLVLPTLATNPYGILNISGAAKLGGSTTYSNNIDICGDFSLTGADFDMVTSTGYLNMLHLAGDVTYTGDVEVLGRFRRTFDVAAVNDEYTFNNANTTFLVEAVPANGTYYELDVRPSTQPHQYDGDMDVERKITADYDLDNMTYTLKLGYLTSEVPAFAGDAAGLTEDDLKFFESNAGGIEKVAGTGYVNDQSSTFHFVSLAGLKDGNAAVEGSIENIIAAGNDIVLRANNTMYSIVDGRWSNPNVWDEGRIPEETDNVELRSMVYVGIDGPFAGTIGGTDGVATQNMKAEFDDYGNGFAANKITIADQDGSALIIGNEDNGASYVHRTKFNGTAFVNKNTNAPAAYLGFPIVAKSSVKDNSLGNEHGLNGLWLTGYGANTSMFGAQQIENNGSINNQGIIEVGQ